MRWARARWGWLAIILVSLALVVRGTTDSMWREIVIGSVVAVGAAARLIWG